MKAEDYRVEERVIDDVPIKITSYKIGGRYHCHVANQDPGATIARAESITRDEAEENAIAKARKRLKPAVVK